MATPKDAGDFSQSLCGEFVESPIKERITSTLCPYDAAQLDEFTFTITGPGTGEYVTTGNVEFVRQDPDYDVFRTPNLSPGVWSISFDIVNPDPYAGFLLAWVYVGNFNGTGASPGVIDTVFPVGFVPAGESSYSKTTMQSQLFCEYALWTCLGDPAIPGNVEVSCAGIRIA